MHPVIRENLKIGSLYYIESLEEDGSGNLVPNKKLSIMVGIFKRLKPVFGADWWNAAVFDWFDISKMKHVNNKSDACKYIIREVELNYVWNFYEVKKIKIQCDMEERAVNLYLQKIIGDQYFLPFC
jgi:hypothetical protein